MIRSISWGTPQKLKTCEFSRKTVTENGNFWAYRCVACPEINFGKYFGDELRKKQTKKSYERCVYNRLDDRSQLYFLLQKLVENKILAINRRSDLTKFINIYFRNKRRKKDIPVFVQLIVYRFVFKLFHIASYSRFNFWLETPTMQFYQSIYWLCIWITLKKF